MKMIHKQKTLLYFKLIDVLKCHKPIHKHFQEYINFNTKMVTENKIVRILLKWNNSFG